MSRFKSVEARKEANRKSSLYEAHKRKVDRILEKWLVTLQEMDRLFPSFTLLTEVPLSLEDTLVEKYHELRKEFEEVARELDHQLNRKGHKVFILYP